MLVPQYAIRLSAAEQQALEALQRAGKTPQQTVRRVTILLLAQARVVQSGDCGPGRHLTELGAEVAQTLCPV